MPERMLNRQPAPVNLMLRDIGKRLVFYPRYGEIGRLRRKTYEDYLLAVGIRKDKILLAFQNIVC